MWSGEAVGREQLSQLQRQGLPDLDAFRASVDQSVSRLRPLAAGTGPEQPHHEQRLEAQEARQSELNRQFPSSTTFRPFPADPSKLDEARAYAGPVPAVLVIHEQGQSIPLTMYLRAWHDTSGWNARLVDLTGKNSRTYDGAGDAPNAAYRAAFAEWAWAHEYPRGNTVVYSFTAVGLTLPGEFETSNPRNFVTSVADWILSVGGIIVAGVLIVVPDPSMATKAAGIALMLAAIARGTFAIYDNVSHGVEWLDTRNVIEAVGIAASIAGVSGTALRSAGLSGARVVRPAVFRAGSWLVWTSVAADSGTFLFLAAEGVAQLRAVEADPTLDDHQRATQMVQVLSRLAAQGLMFVVSNKDFFSTEFRASRLYRESIGSRDGVRLGREERIDLELALRDAGEDAAALRQLTDLQLIEHHARIAEATATAGTRGPQAYRVRAGSGASSIGRLRSLARRFADPSSDLHQRMHGATLSNVTQVSGGDPPLVRATLTVPLEGGTSATVAVTIRSVATADQPRGPHGAGGSETGPATMRITRNDDGTYRGDVHVNRDLHATDARDAVGHELDELAGVVRGGYSGDAIRRQQRAGLLRPDAAQRPASPTVHDRAQARELRAAWARTSGPASARVQSLRQSGKLAAWGLDTPRHVEEKIDFLRSQGVDETLLQHLHADLAHARLVLPGGSPPGLTADRIRHILYPDTGSSSLSFVSGAHWEPQLRGLSDPSLELVEVASRQSGQDTYRAFAQCRWIGPGTKPSPGDPRYPQPIAAGQPGYPGVTYINTLWEVAQNSAGVQTMKTTFASPQSFLQEVEDAWARWLQAPTGAGANIDWSATTATGLRVAGHASGNSSSGYDLRSAFPAQSWF